VKTRFSGLVEDEIRVSSGRLWTWRISSVVFGLGACGFLVWANVRTDMSLLTFCCLSFFVITLATLVAIYGETQYNREALEGQDLELYRRIKRAQLPHVIGIMCAMSLYPVLYALSRQYGHTSMLESWVIGFLPCAFLVRGVRRLWPVQDVTEAEDRRVGLLTVDRHRRRQAMFFVVFAALCLVYVSMWIPQMLHAVRGQPIQLGMFDGIGVPALTFLLFLAGPSLIGGRAVLRYFPEDETLIHFRNIAYRNGFFVIGLGMILICDVVRQPPRLAIVLVPMVLNIGLTTAFLTMAVLEYRSGTFESSGEALPTEDRTYTKAR
jgi:hypothetical protein